MSIIGYSILDIVFFCERAKILLDIMFDYHPVHLMALFLNPRTRKMKQCSSTQRNCCLEYVKQEMLLFDASYIQIGTVDRDLPTKHPKPHSGQIFRIMERYYEDESDQDDLPTTTAALHQMEIDSYLKFGADKPEENSSSSLGSKNEEYNPLLFWKVHHHLYPRLAKIAKRIFAVPATSAAVEREFSSAGNLVTKKRSRLSPEMVNDIIFQHSFDKHRRKQAG